MKEQFQRDIDDTVAEMFDEEAAQQSNQLETARQSDQIAKALHFEGEWKMSSYQLAIIARNTTLKSILRPLIQ